MRIAPEIKGFDMTSDNAIAQAKQVVLDHFEAIDHAPTSGLSDAVARNCADDCVFHFTHPFPDDVGLDEAVRGFWTPLRASFAPLQRRQDIFCAGFNDLDDGESLWVVSMGHLLGRFDSPFLGGRKGSIQKSTTKVTLCKRLNHTFTTSHQSSSLES